ncbi:MAG: cytochrome c [Alphaproteobacteria bacterium]|nr:cytochrome c [Alphaproteobacteria bacterium]
MRPAFKLSGILAVAAVAGLVILPACMSSAVGASDAIKERRALMKSISKEWKPIKAYAKSGKGSAAGVAKHATAINGMSKKINGLFPKGSGRGDFSDKETRALPAIWKDWTGFEKAAGVLEQESAKLIKIAGTGDQKAIAKQVGAMGKKGCGGCHKPFRGAKVK